jgi:hypothetical protein
VGGIWRMARGCGSRGLKHSGYAARESRERHTLPIASEVTWPDLDRDCVCVL